MQVNASMLPIFFKHFEATPATYRARLSIVGLPRHHCVAERVADVLMDGTMKQNASGSGSLQNLLQCAEGVTMSSTGLSAGLGGLNSSTTLTTLTCVSLAENACEVTMTCQECLANEALLEIGFAVAGRFAMAHGIAWAVGIQWTREGPVHGRSDLSGAIAADPGSVLRGERESTIELGLLPTVYTNHLNGTAARGYQLQYERTTVGASVTADAFHRAQGQLNVRMQFRPTLNQFTIVVNAMHTLLEFVAACLSLASGLAFLSRLSLWCYSKFLIKHATRLGASVQEEYRKLRERRHMRPRHTWHAVSVRRLPLPHAPTCGLLCLVHRGLRCAGEREAHVRHLHELRRRARQNAAVAFGGRSLWRNLSRGDEEGRSEDGSLSDSAVTDGEGVGQAIAMPQQPSRRSSFSDHSSRVLDTALSFLETLMDRVPTQHGGFQSLHDEEREEAGAGRAADAAPTRATFKPQKRRRNPFDLGATHEEDALAAEGKADPKAGLGQVGSAAPDAGAYATPLRPPLERQKSSGAAFYPAGGVRSAGERTAPAAWWGSGGGSSRHPERRVRRAGTWSGRAAEELAALARNELLIERRSERNGTFHARSRSGDHGGVGGGGGDATGCGDGSAAASDGGDAVAARIPGGSVGDAGGASVGGRASGTDGASIAGSAGGGAGGAGSAGDANARPGDASTNSPDSSAGLGDACSTNAHAGHQ